jgi:hypothetical protein
MGCLICCCQVQVRSIFSRGPERAGLLGGAIPIRCGDPQRPRLVRPALVSQSQVSQSRPYPFPSSSLTSLYSPPSLHPLLPSISLSILRLFPPSIYAFTDPSIPAPVHLSRKSLLFPTSLPCSLSAPLLRLLNLASKFRINLPPLGRYRHTRADGGMVLSWRRQVMGAVRAGAVAAAGDLRLRHPARAPGEGGGGGGGIGECVCGEFFH